MLFSNDMGSSRVHLEPDATGIYPPWHSQARHLLCFGILEKSLTLAFKSPFMNLFLKLCIY